MWWNKCVFRQISKPRKFYILSAFTKLHPIPGHGLSKPGKKKSGENARMYLLHDACTFSRPLIGRNCQLINLS